MKDDERPNDTRRLLVADTRLVIGSAGLLLAPHESPRMNLLLAVHLVVAFSLFIAMPYGKFLCGIYHFPAL